MACARRGGPGKKISHPSPQLPFGICEFFVTLSTQDPSPAGAVQGQAHDLKQAAGGV